jgi:hypothetical protein
MTPDLDEGISALHYRGVLASASGVSFVSLLITFWVWWPKEEGYKLGLLLLLPVFLPYAFIPLRLYGHRLRTGLTLAMSMGGALFVPGIYLIRFAITWDNRWWVLCNLIVAILMQLPLFIIALTAYIRLPRLPRPGLRDLAGPAYGFCLCGLFLLLHSPVPRYISNNEATAMSHLFHADDILQSHLGPEVDNHGMPYPEAVDSWGPKVSGACTVEDSTLLPRDDGYVFEYRGVPPSSTLQGCTRFKGFIMTARPVTFGKTGVRSFYVSNQERDKWGEGLIIHFTSQNRPAVATDPTVHLEHRHVPQ